MIYIVWFSLCVACGYYAKSKGRSFGKNFIGAILFSPLLIAIILLLSKSKKADNLDESEYILNEEVTYNSNKTREEKEANSVYYNAELSKEVKGVFAENKRIKSFRNAKIGDEIILDFNVFNDHDKYAIEIYDKSNNQIGFVPKGNRKLHRSLEQGANYFSYVNRKSEYYSEEYDRDYFSMDITIYIGFNEKNTSIIRNLFLENILFLSSYKLKEYDVNIEKSDFLIDSFVELMSDSNILNLYQKRKLDLSIDFDKITINAIRAKQEIKSIEYYNKLKPILDKSKMWKEGRFDKLQSRIEKLLVKYEVN